MARRSKNACVMLALATSTPLALAQEAGEAPAQTAFTGGTVLVIEHADLRAFFPDERDQGLLHALEMVPARVRELPGEAGDEFTGEVAGIVNTIITALAKPGRLAVVYDETPTGGFFGYGLVASVQTADRAEAQTLHTKVRSLVRKANPDLRFGKSNRFEGMQDLQLPVGLLSMGPREAADGWRYEIILGTVPEPDAAGAVIKPAPEGFTPLVRAYFNPQGLAPAIDMVTAAAGGGEELPPQAAGIAQMMQQGLITTYDAGYTGESLVSRMEVQSARSAADLLMIGTEPLAAEDLRVIPADATNAYIRRLHEGWASSFVESLSAASLEAEEGMQEFEQFTGVNLHDLAASIGDRVCVYTSDMTGGGGLGSLVGMVSIQDREGLEQSLGQLIEFANEAAREETRGYLQIARWEDGGTTLYSLRFPGVPVPLELTLGLTDQWLVMAPLPQAAVAASRQITGGSAGLVPSARTAGFVPADAKMVEFSFTDTTRSMRAGYPLLSLLGSAVANMVRSPSEGDREPGMVIPLYAELVSSVRPSVKVTTWEGDNLVTVSTSSKSLVVNLGSAFGTVSKLLPIIAAGAAVGAAQQEQFVSLHETDRTLGALAALAMPLPDRLALRAAMLALPGEQAPLALKAVLHPASGGPR